MADNSPIIAPRVRGKTLAMAAASGLLLVASFPHLDWGWLAWAALVPFLCTFPHRTWRGALAHGTVLGLVFFAGLMYWIGVFASHAAGPVLAGVTWVGATLSMTATLTVFGLGACWLDRLSARAGNRAFWVWGVPALWTMLEWARQFGILGTTWGDLAFTQHRALVLLQVTKFAGPWGLSFLVVLGNVTVAELLRGRRTVGLAVLALAASLVFGAATLQGERLRPTFVAAALQGNINQDVALTPGYVRTVLDTFGAQSAAAQARGAVLTVWPETAIPGYLRTDPALLLPVAQIAAAHGQTLLVGARDYDARLKRDTNTLFLVTSQGRVAGQYSKRRLVPFGEYVPLRAWFPVLERLHLTIYDMAPGAERQPLLDAPPPIGKVGAAICYDSTYAGLMREQAARGASLLVVTTDDTWFGRTAAANQHAAMAAIDAAASDRYLIRCAATGISQVIDPTGRVIASARLFEPAVVSAPVQSRHTQTVYVRCGDWFVALCGLGLLGAAGLSVSARGRRAGTARSSGP